MDMRENTIQIHLCDKKILELQASLKLQLQWMMTIDSFDFLNLIQGVVVCGYIGIVNFVESNHDWVASLGVLLNTQISTQLQFSLLSVDSYVYGVALSCQKTHLINSNNRTIALVPVGFLPQNLNLSIPFYDHQIKHMLDDPVRAQHFKFHFIFHS